jgi:hypothetical protein
MNFLPLLEHAAGAAAGGSPLYQLSADHIAGLIALLVLPAAFWIVRRRGAPALAPLQWLLLTLLAASAALHAGLAVAHSDHAAQIRLVFLIDAVLLGVVARRVLRGSGVGRLGVAVLVGSIVAYWGSAVTGEPPDQIGLATKLGELLALAIVVQQAALRAPRSRVRGVARAFALVVLVIGTGASSWIGAFKASADGPGAVAGHHVHAGGVAAPGTVMPAVPARNATPEEIAAAEQLVSTARAALARYADPAVAAADGFQVAGMHGIDFHAANPAYEHDGRVFDPSHPETLVYAVAPDGRPVLMGAMFLMPAIGEPGPTVGGPLTVWHAHEHVCLQLMPPGLAGLLSPLGTCPIGTFDLPLTAQMIHIWIVPGAPDPIGDLDDAWKRAFLQATVARP